MTVAGNLVEFQNKEFEPDRGACRLRAIIPGKVIMTDTSIRNLLDALPLAALFVDTQDRIAGANAGALALLGEHVAGRYYVTALRQPDLLDAIESCGRRQIARETRYLLRDGERDATYVVKCGWIDAADIRGVLVSFKDVSDLEAAGQMRRDFVANVSHELRTPLTALMGFIETLRGPARSDPVAQERFLGIMQAEAERMERLVKDLLSLSRVEAQERMRPAEEVDLAALARSVLHGFAPVAHEAGVALADELPAGACMVPGDEDQLRQLISNLVENAIKYGGAGGAVTLSLVVSPRDATLRGPAVVLSVRDEGQGIDPIHIPRLTERFYRVDSHRSRQVGGTGLGLAIVKHIVSRHRGRLRIDSEPGQGSTFTVILPAA
ncbi:MAG: two-component system, OmpR family, phosphate regulon sensor histidine kinase PhoR [Rhodobacteraceae bacterium HLUCCO07]|nr:MAG: two-component system, OmpR family, phosphate regulon sensor histidine kinase PhoR [Rhodobacteraceae bacterium HLUCCO07]